jgi:altronate dehydratase
MTVEDFALVLNSRDNVGISLKNIPNGETIDFQGKTVAIKHALQVGSRFSLEFIPNGEYIYQFGYAFAQSKGITAGEIISTENTFNKIPISSDQKIKPANATILQEIYQGKTFNGFLRNDGRVGTRNYIAIIPTSMCAAEVANQVSRHYDNDQFYKTYRNIDGVVSLAHTEGCGCGAGTQIDRTMTVLKNHALHPNVAAMLFIDLGCEQTNYTRMHAYLNQELIDTQKPTGWITIQEAGGVEKTIKQGIEIVNSFLDQVNGIERKECSLSHLVVGTECGASDTFSGITANPVIGNTLDKVIYGGGSGILSEIPEMLGVFEMLKERFASSVVAEKFSDAVKWYINIAEKLNVDIFDNLVPKNKSGGLMNSYIKSMGAVMKGGSTRIEDIVDYGASLTKSGLSIMQGPGNDLESVTGLVSCGANIICFSTGHGTITGSAIAPVIKVCSNSTTYNKLENDMDFNAGRLLEDEFMDDLSEELLDKVIRVASGEKTWSEKWKQHQFQIWTAGKLSL